MNREECLERLIQLEDRMARNETTAVDLERIVIYKLVNDIIEMLEKEGERSNIDVLTNKQITK